MEALQQKFGAKFIATTSSGTASIHTAVAAAGIPAGYEVITSPITDAGTVFAILFQNAIPVFADVDPTNSNITASTIEAAITPRTRAVVVVHLTGCPADLDPIVELCKKKGLILIEDCAQALGALYHGKPLGIFGDFGCYSLNDQKHITSGEGGFVITNSEERYYLCHNHADKYYDRYKRGVRLHGMGPNYRMSELDGAMTLAQLPKLDAIVSRRRKLGDYLTTELSKLTGIIAPTKPAGAECSYFYYQFRIDERQLNVSRDQFIKKLEAEGIPAKGGYLPWPLYRAPVFQNKAFFYGGVWPAEAVAGKAYDYAKVSLPSTELALSTTISLTLHEGFSDADISDYIKGIRVAAGL